MQPPSWSELFVAARDRHPGLVMLAAGTALLTLILAILILFDGVTILGINRWIKPLKFAMSISIYTFTMALILAMTARRAAAARIAAVIVIAMTGEISLILIQASRGVRSHFNTGTSFDAAVFNAMGLLIMANTVAAAFACWLILRDRTIMPLPWRMGLVAGLFLFVIASVEGGLMVHAGAHTVGAPDGGPGLPLVNWSRQSGDLRIAHFLGMHALQALPLVGWIAAASPLSQRAAGRLIVAVAVVWLGAFTALLLQALAGAPLIGPG